MAVYNDEGNIAAVSQHGRKMKLLEVRRILETETDPEHTLTANQIATKLEARGFDKPDRKGIYDDINVLNYFYKPDNRRKGLQPYFIEKDEETFGYYLDRRLFSIADIKLIIDAVQSSKFLSEAKTQELIEALETLCSKHQAKALKRQLIVSNRIKNMNTSIHNSVDHINYAIDNNVTIRFKYFDYDIKMRPVFRRKGEWYEISPLVMVYSDDNYYVIACDHKDGKVKNFRIDRMSKVNATINPRTGTELFTKEDAELYQTYSFNMYGGDMKNVTMRFRNNMMNTVIDKFGKKITTYAVDKDHFEIEVRVAVSPQFYGWVFGLKNYVTIVSPPEVVKGMKKHLEAVMKRYEKPIEKPKDG